MISNRYSIKDLELLSGIKAHTIRIWEKRYNLLKPDRTSTNIRYYDDEDLRRLINVALLVKNNFKISKIAAWEPEKISNEVISLDKTKVSETGWIDKLVISLLKFNETEFVELINRIISLYGYEEAFLSVFFPFLEKIGTYWLAGTVFPAQERFASNVLRQKLINKINNNSFDKNRKTVLCFLHEKEQHELSLLFYATIMRNSGYNIIYLGTQIPFTDLGKIATTARIDIVFTAFINAISEDTLRTYIKDVAKLFPSARLFATGYQLQKLGKSSPGYVTIIRNLNDLRKSLDIHFS
jgi:methanogenic corrinoid protein MtbC1